MEAYQQRVIDEKRELDEKLTKLKAFITDGDRFFQVPELERERLVRQLQHMADYSSVLRERIVAFK
jgi:hypothetical protein